MFMAESLKRCIISDNHQPSFNLAAEEWLLQQNDDFLFFYINQPSVIIGRNQNAFAEVNMAMAEQLQIPIIRRLSGGGAVYHDLGNVNFAFIFNESSTSSSYEYCLNEIVECLNSLSVKGCHIKGTAIYYQNFKISGAAKRVSAKRAIIHGTLLFNSNIEVLHAILKNNKKINGKWVKSNPAHVINISSLLNSDINTFLNNLKIYFVNKGFQLSCLNSEKLKALEEKYSLWEWNMGMSPSFTQTIDYKNQSLTFSVEKGIINELKVNEVVIRQVVFKQEVIRNILNTFFSTNEANNLITLLF
jgi:lipoate---protein ligase